MATYLGISPKPTDFPLEEVQNILCGDKEDLPEWLDAHARKFAKTSLVGLGDVVMGWNHYCFGGKPVKTRIVEIEVELVNRPLALLCPQGGPQFHNNLGFSFRYTGIRLKKDGTIFGQGNIFSLSGFSLPDGAAWEPAYKGMVRGLPSWSIASSLEPVHRTRPSF